MISKSFVCDADSSPLSKGLLHRAGSSIMRYVPIAPHRSVLKRRMRRLVQVTVPGLLLSLAACGGNVDPNIQLNPDPSMRYEVTYRIGDPAISFDSVEAIGSYDVSNDACVPSAPVSGVRAAPTKVLPLTIEKIDTQTFKVVVFADALHDDDYFSLGACHWSLVATSFIGKRAGAALSTAISAADIFSSTHSVTYYSRTWLTGGPSQLTDGGSTTTANYDDPSNVFVISANAEGSR